LPSPQAGGPPIVCCLLLLIQYIRSYPPYWRPFVHPQPEDAPCRGDRAQFSRQVQNHQTKTTQTVVGLEPLNMALINTETHRSKNENVSEETQRSARQLVGKGWNTYLSFAFSHIFIFIFNLAMGLSGLNMQRVINRTRFYNKLHLCLTVFSFS